MIVHHLASADGYEWIVPVDDADFELFLSFDGRSRRIGWKPVRMRLVKELEDAQVLKEADFPWLGRHAPVLRRNAVDVVGPS